MKQIKLDNKALLAAIAGDNMQQRNQALRQLYMDPVITVKVKEFVHNFGTSKQDPEDILQEGIIQLDESIRLGKFKGNSAVRTYLLGICKNLIRAQTRKVDRIDLLDSLPDHSDDGEHVGPEGNILLIEEEDAVQQRNQILLSLMRQLTKNCQDILTRYYFKAQKMKQIAQARGLKNDHQAKKATSRCREQLRKRIASQPDLQNFLKMHT